MSRTSVLLGALASAPTSASDLYERVGYLELTRIGLGSYPSFRAELDKLTARGLAASDTGADGSTLWRRTGPLPDHGPGSD
jgi:hypothetical protein